jgi:signal transduction histidine kinase
MKRSGDLLMSGAREPADVRIEDLHEALRARDDFLAIAAHELRNPLTPIMLSLQLIRTAADAEDPAALRREIDRLERLLEHFALRAGTLLDIARLNAADFKIERAHCDVSEVVKCVVRDYAPVVELRRYEIITKIQEKVVAEVDANATSEIVENLLSNAIKYGQGKPIEVGVIGESDQVRISVRDQGIGIAPEDRAVIFERFERLVGKNYRTGFGVGLWVARKFAEAMGGAIKLESRPGEGSTFTLVLQRKLSSQ